jgi:hypothetical protein
VFQALSNAIRGPGLFFDARDGGVLVTASSLTKSDGRYFFEIEVSGPATVPTRPAGSSIAHWGPWGGT